MDMSGCHLHSTAPKPIDILVTVRPSHILAFSGCNMAAALCLLWTLCCQWGFTVFSLLHTTCHFENGAEGKWTTLMFFYSMHKCKQHLSWNTGRVTEFQNDSLTSTNLLSFHNASALWAISSQQVCWMCFFINKVVAWQECHKLQTSWTTYTHRNLESLALRN